MDTTALRTAAALIEAEIATEAASPKPTYTVSTAQGSQTVDWNGYHQILLERLTKIRELINAYDPYIVATKQYIA